MRGVVAGKRPGRTKLRKYGIGSPLRFRDVSDIFRAIKRRKRNNVKIFSLYLHKYVTENPIVMSKKSERLDVIRNLIDSEQISSQEELLSWLKRVGIDATQSTLSRDMKELRAIKVPDAEKGYIYLLPETLQAEQTSGKVSSSVTDNIRYIEFSGNMIVIRTKAGYAKAVGVMVDNEDYDDVLGTLAGDDTVFVLLAEGVKPLDFLPSFDSIHPDIKTLYNPEGRKKNNAAMRRRFF